MIALTNAEILDLHTPNKYFSFFQPECRCSNDYPRNENDYSMYCLKNKPDDALNEKLTRLNKYSHNIGFLNDNNLETTWISCISTNPVNIVIDLFNGDYVLERIEIYFSSLPPTDLVLQRYFNNEWIEIQTYSVNCSSNLNCVSLPK